MSARPAGLTLFVCMLACAAVLGYTGRDDSHITYFAADQLASGNGLADHSGRTVEMSSSLGFTALLAAASLATGLSGAAMGPFVSAFLWFAAGLLAAYWLNSRHRSAWLGVLAGLVPAGVYWGLSGMETSLYVLELLIYVCLAERTLRSEASLRSLATPSLALAACVAALTRPEASFVLLTSSVFAAFVWVFLERKPLPWAFLCASVGGVLAALGFRLLLGLRVFPNPVYAKQALALNTRLSMGWQYFENALRDSPATSVLAFGLLAWGFGFGISSSGIRRERASAGLEPAPLLCWSLAVAVCAFSFSSGGDWMEFGRFFVPAYFFAFLAAAYLLSRRAARRFFLASTAMLLADFGLMACYELGGIPVWAAQESDARLFQPAWVERFSTIHVRDLRFTDGMIDALRQDPRSTLVIASVQAGMVLYYLDKSVGKQLEFVDLYGLTSRHVHGCTAWMSDPYENWEKLQRCINRKIDYVFDLDMPGRMDLLRSRGCSEVIVDEITVEPIPTKRHSWRQFLMRCSDAGQP